MIQRFFNIPTSTVEYTPVPSGVLEVEVEKTVEVSFSQDSVEIETPLVTEISVSQDSVEIETPSVLEIEID